jgi:hypothetical protein
MSAGGFGDAALASHFPSSFLAAPVALAGVWRLFRLIRRLDGRASRRLPWGDEQGAMMMMMKNPPLVRVGAACPPAQSEAALILFPTLIVI